MKKESWLIILFIGILLVGCQRGVQKVSLRQTKEEIVCIELMYDESPYLSDDREILYTLADNEIDSFVKALCDLEVKKHWSPSGGLGRIFVRISYKDGSQELIGVSAIMYIAVTGEMEADDWHSADYNGILELFSKYVGETKMPSLK